MGDGGTARKRFKRPCLPYTVATFIACLALASGAHAQSASEPDNVPQDAESFLAPLLSPDPPQDCFRTVNLRSPALEGQKAVAERPAPLRRLMIAIDSSGSMRALIGGERKIDAAKTAVRSFLSSLPQDIEVGLMVFGHRGSSSAAGKSESCGAGAVETLFAPAKDREGVLRSVDAVVATGWTPLAAAIEQARTEFTHAEREGEQALYLVSDGIETCGGQPVAAARSLRAADVKVIVNIVGFDVPSVERKAMEEIAEAGGGRFLNAATGRDVLEGLKSNFENTVRASRDQFAATSAQSSNQFDTTSAISHANFCTTSLISKEQFRFNSAVNKARFARRADENLIREAEDLLKARHAAIDAARDAYVAAMETANEVKAEEIRQNLERALMPGTKRP